MGRKKRMKMKAGKMDRTSPKEVKVAVIWTRVSTKEQADHNMSLETQEKACLEYAKRNNIEVDKIMGQTNESAKTEGKLYQEMITYVSMHRSINIILVYSYDRFSRAGAEAIVTKAYLKSKGITVVSVTQPIDSDSKAGEFMENMIFLFNQFENNLRKEKCTAGMTECLERGEWFSRPPIGYQIDRSTKEKHRLVIDEKGVLIGKAFHWKANENVSDTEILRRLRLEGWEVQKQKLSEIFHNPFYCGKIRHHLLGDRIVQGVHPPIVDEHTFNVVNGIETHNGYAHADVTPEVPLKRHVICPVCGKHMTGYEVKAKHIWYYKCNTKGCKCNKSAKVMHQKYIELLARYQVPEDVREILKNVVESRARSFLVSMTDRLMDLRRRKGILMGEKNDVMLRFGKGIIPGDVYDVTRRNLDAQIDEIDAEINDLAEKNSNLEIDVAEAILTACKLGDLWKNGDFDLRQRIQKMVSPKGLNWDRENENYRTISENEALRVFRLFSESYKKEDKEKTGKSFDFSGLVAEAGLEPTTSGL